MSDKNSDIIFHILKIVFYHCGDIKDDNANGILPHRVHLSKLLITYFRIKRAFKPRLKFYRNHIFVYSQRYLNVSLKY